jgi:hypothetical protein
MMGLGIVAANIAGKVQICASPGYVEPLQIYTATALTSGNGKTAVINEMAAPLLISHALAAFRIMQKSEKVEHAEKLLGCIVRNGKPEFHLRKMFRSQQSRFAEMAALMPAVLLLQEHGYIRQMEKERKVGRPPDVFDVNPEALGGEA